MAKAKAKGATNEKKDQSGGVSLLVAVIAACATLLAFQKDYGWTAFGLFLMIGAALAVFQLWKGETLGAYLTRTFRRGLIIAFGILFLFGIPIVVISATNAYQVSDWFRPQFRSGPIDQKSYMGSAAPWAVAAPEGTGADARAASDTEGWKRLMNTALTNDPQNASGTLRQLFYLESVSFDRSYHSFTAELVLPTTVAVNQVFAFLTSESTSGRPYEQLQCLRAEPLGVDKNKCHVIVSSPNAGERLKVFVVASAKAMPFPKDVESSIVLRSIK